MHARGRSRSFPEAGTHREGHGRSGGRPPTWRPTVPHAHALVGSWPRATRGVMLRASRGQPAGALAALPFRGFIYRGGSPSPRAPWGAHGSSGARPPRPALPRCELRARGPEEQPCPQLSARKIEPLSFVIWEIDFIYLCRHIYPHTYIHMHTCVCIYNFLKNFCSDNNQADVCHRKKTLVPGPWALTSR